MRIMLLGDTHGNSSWTKRMIERASHLNCDTILQLGDFGFWEHTERGKDFLKQVSKHSGKHNIDFYWVDGNHENFDLLFSGQYKAAKHAPFWKIRDNLFYIPRGTVWDWDGYKFAGLGGAVSIDRDDRIPGASWWNQETIKDRDLMELEANVQGLGRIDFMLMHDAPYLPASGRRNYKNDEASHGHRKLVQIALDIASPRYLFHGHYHYFYRGNYTNNHGADIELLGLDCDNAIRCYAVLELGNFGHRLTFPWNEDYGIPNKLDNPRVG